MIFKTPCFVRVEDAEEREKLRNWCVGIGYWAIDVPPEEQNGTLVICEGNEEMNSVGTVHDAHVFTNAECIDCGTDVELFKALAAMNDENNHWQYHICIDAYCFNDIRTGDLILEHGEDDHRLFHYPFFRKATVKEIVEHFKNRKL